MRTMSSGGTFLKDVKAERTTAMAFLEEARSDPHVKLFVRVGTARATHLIGGAFITKYSNIPGLEPQDKDIFGSGIDSQGHHDDRRGEVTHHR